MSLHAPSGKLFDVSSHSSPELHWHCKMVVINRPQNESGDPHSRHTRPLPNHDSRVRNSEKTTEFRIDAEILIPGRGDPIQPGILIYSASETAGGTGKILFVGKPEDLPQTYRKLPTQVSAPVLMSGLWDCHVHFLGEARPTLEHLALLPQALAGARGARDVAATLNAGFTSVREVAGYGVELSQAVNEGWLPGPNIYSSVAAISQTAGHGDLHTMPLALIKDTINHGLPMCICDGVDECIKSVRLQIRRGAKVIKVCATGGVMSRIDSPTAPQFFPPELRAMVEEAARASLIVAAHCHGKAGIMAALEAGVRTIEHGSYLDKEAIDLMLDKGAMLIATRSIIAMGVDHPENMPPESYKKMLEIADDHKKAYAAAVWRSPCRCIIKACGSNHLAGQSRSEMCPGYGSRIQFGSIRIQSWNERPRI